MKRTIVALTVSMSTLLVTPAFAGEGSSRTNAEVVAFQQRLAHCINSAKSEGFNCNTYVGCGERKSYVASCMSGDDTPVQYASIHRTLAPTADPTAVAADYNRILQDAPTAAGNK